MMNLVSNEEIQETKIYQKLEKVFQKMVMKYNNKKAISEALIVYNSTGVIPSSIGGNNLHVLKGIIENRKSLS
jgi:ribosomal protein S7